MRIHNCLRLTNLRSGKARMVGQSHLRREPELGFAINVRNMHMNARLFT